MWLVTKHSHREKLAGISQMSTEKHATRRLATAKHFCREGRSYVQWAINNGSGWCQSEAQLTYWSASDHRQPRQSNAPCAAETVVAWRQLLTAASDAETSRGTPAKRKGRERLCKQRGSRNWRRGGGSFREGLMRELTSNRVAVKERAGEHSLPGQGCPRPAPEQKATAGNNGDCHGPRGWTRERVGDLDDRHHVTANAEISHCRFFF